jgi:hypothetical protein
MKKGFQLGQCVATPGALRALEDNQTFPLLFLRRHARGDWGKLSDHDKGANEDALISGDRILSNYPLDNGERIWVITDAENDDNVRESTCILLPDEY